MNCIKQSKYHIFVITKVFQIPKTKVELCADMVGLCAFILKNYRKLSNYK